MFTWGLIVFSGLWLILRDVNPITRAKLMGSPMIIHIIVATSTTSVYPSSPKSIWTTIAHPQEKRHAWRSSTSRRANLRTFTDWRSASASVKCKTSFEEPSRGHQRGTAQSDTRERRLSG